MLKRVRKLSGLRSNNGADKEKSVNSSGNPAKTSEPVIVRQPSPRTRRKSTKTTEQTPKKSELFNQQSLSISDDPKRDRRELFSSTALSVADPIGPSPEERATHDPILSSDVQPIPGTSGTNVGSSDPDVTPKSGEFSLGSSVRRVEFEEGSPKGRKKTSSPGRSKPIKSSPSHSRSRSPKSPRKFRLAQSQDSFHSPPKSDSVKKGIIKYHSVDKISCYALADKTPPDDILTAVVSPNSTSIVITQPSSSSPSPTNPNKSMKSNPISSSNTLQVSPKSSTGQVVPAEPDEKSTDNLETSSDIHPESPKSVSGSPKKLSFIAPPDVSEGGCIRRIAFGESNLKSGWSKSHPSLHTSSLRSSSFSLYSPYASRTSFPAVHGSSSSSKRTRHNNPAILKKHHSLSSVSQSQLSVHKKYSMPASYSSLNVSVKPSGRATPKTSVVRKCHSFSSTYHSPLSCPVRRSSVSPSRGGNRSYPVSPKRKASSVYLAVSSCVCCR